MFPTLSDAGFSWVSSNLTHPDFGTTVQLGLGSVCCEQHTLSLSPMNGRVVWLQRVDDRDLESFASDAIAEVRWLVLGPEELKPKSTDVGRVSMIAGWLLASLEKRRMWSLKLTFLRKRGCGRARAGSHAKRS